MKQKTLCRLRNTRCLLLLSVAASLTFFTDPDAQAAVPLPSTANTENGVNLAVTPQKVIKATEIEVRNHSNADDPADVVFTTPEQMPEFPGGPAALMRYVNRHLIYPRDAKKAGIEGRVICNFIIGKDGEVTDAKVTRGVHPSLDAEALRIIYTLPAWKPGMQKGEKVRVKYTLPIVFRLP